MAHLNRLPRHDVDVERDHVADLGAVRRQPVRQLAALRWVRWSEGSSVVLLGHTIESESPPVTHLVGIIECDLLLQQRLEEFVPQPTHDAGALRVRVCVKWSMVRDQKLPTNQSAHPNTELNYTYHQPEAQAADARGDGGEEAQLHHALDLEDELGLACWVVDVCQSHAPRPSLCQHNRATDLSRAGWRSAPARTRGAPSPPPRPPRAWRWPRR